MSEWQPIETAPKDGTVILLFVPEDDAQLTDAYQITAAWDGLMGGCWMDNARGSWWGFGPTHWMPLPNPPQGETQ